MREVLRGLGCGGSGLFIETPFSFSRINSLMPSILAAASESRWCAGAGKSPPAKEPDMKVRLVLMMTLCMMAMAAAATAETIAGLPLHVQKLESGAIRVWIGDHISSTATTAIPTEKGLIIIDTTGNPKIDRQLRSVIARELGRDDFKILINTHEHGDHTGGNLVYADCMIVGHELVAEGMNRGAGDRQRTIDWLTGRIAEQEAELGGLAADTPEVARLREDLILNRLQLEVAQAGEKPVPPTKTFRDRLVLDLGDTTCELYYIGGMHTASDIAVFVPQHGLLMTGDTMADVWLTDTPGCLASFIARPGVRHDFPLLLENWNLLLGKKDSIKKLLTGHWNGELTIAGFEARVKYVETLWDAVVQAAAAGGNLDDLLAEYRLEMRFPELVESPGFSARNNYTTIMEMWLAASGQESAAQAVYDLIDEGAGEFAIQKVVAQREVETSNYFFLEAEFNALGYRFLQQEKAGQAAAMFKINVELFPESWNVYDSLGEALLAAGDREAAIAMYEKSLEINPENTNGREALARIRNEASVN
jgi:glyoxylase-like metal-dependent hydrolase (beta-lactamase superfamily II)